MGYLPCNNRGKTRLRLSPLLSMILLDWVNKTGTKSQKASDRLLTSFLEDLEFTDDICTHQMHNSKIDLTTLNLRSKEQGLVSQNPEALFTSDVQVFLTVSFPSDGCIAISIRKPHCWQNRRYSNCRIRKYESPEGTWGFSKKP